MAREKKVEHYDVVIIGGGPGGLSAAIYTGRARLKTILIDKLNVLVRKSIKWHQEYIQRGDGLQGRQIYRQSLEEYRFLTC